jgi:hypothetical protein
LSISLLKDTRQIVLESCFESSKILLSNFGAHKSKTLRQIHAFKPSFLEWLCKQSYVQDKFTDILEEAKQLLE